MHADGRCCAGLAVTASVGTFGSASGSFGPVDPLASFAFGAIAAVWPGLLRRNCLSVTLWGKGCCCCCWDPPLPVLLPEVLAAEWSDSLDSAEQVESDREVAEGQRWYGVSCGALLEAGRGGVCPDGQRCGPALLLDLRACFPTTCRIRHC